MLSKKESQILKLLYENRHIYLTSKEIASELYVSERTARKYLHIVGDVIKKAHMGSIEAKQGQGYQLIIEEETLFEQFYQNEVNALPFSRDVTSIHEAKDRQYYILKQLFFEQSEVYVDKIATELFVSRSTVSNDLVEIKKLLKTYDIELKSKANKGIFVVGSEQRFRHFMMNYFFMNRLHDNFYTFSIYRNLLEGISIEEIVIIVLDECRESHLKLSDFIIYNIVLHIALAIKRIQSGFKIELDHSMHISQHSVEYQTALKIVERITVGIGMAFPIEEATYIAMHLQSKIASEFVFQKTPYNESEIREQLLTVLEEFDEETGYDLKHDTILIDGLMTHFTPLLLRLRNKTSIENPLFEEINGKYSRLFDLTIKYFSRMPVFQPYEVTKSEWAYLTIHLTAAVERYSNEHKPRILVICATGLGSSQMLKNRLDYELGSKILIEKVISYYEISEQELDEIDLIISTIHIPNMIHNIPTVYVSVFLDESDLKKINHELSHYKNVKQLINDNVETHLEEKDVQVALINQTFSPDLFLRLELPTTKDAVISQLLDCIENKEGQPINQVLSKQLKLREVYSSVAFSPYLAVPHPIEAVTNSAYAAVAIVPKGVFWDEEHPNIQLIVLLSPDKLGQVKLDKVSQMLVSIIEDDTYRQSLVKSSNYGEFIERFTKQL